MSNLKNVKEHDSPIFQFNGLALKQGEEFAHSFNVKQIEYIEAKLTKVTQDMVGHTQTGSTSTKGERKKQSRRKSSERKRKRTETNVQRVYGICVVKPPGNDLPQ